VTSAKICTVRVPATSANLGPGFDCLGLALDLWNEADFSVQAGAWAGAGASPAPTVVVVEGFGAGRLPLDETNLVAQAALRLFAAKGLAAPALHIHCRNTFPPGSGLGSSSSAILMGLLGANGLIDEPLTDAEILNWAAEIEGHPDNVTPALLGGLTISILGSRGVVAHQIAPAPWWVAVAVPVAEISTHAMRAALRDQVPLRDAVFNLGRVPLVVEALRSGDLPLLIEAMADRLHQPYRLPLIPGAAAAIEAAQNLGVAAALSGAGPGVAAFAQDREMAQACAVAMSLAFADVGLASWQWVGGIAREGANVSEQMRS